MFSIFHNLKIQIHNYVPIIYYAIGAIWFSLLARFSFNSYGLYPWLCLSFISIFVYMECLRRTSKFSPGSKWIIIGFISFINGVSSLFLFAYSGIRNYPEGPADRNFVEGIITGVLVLILNLIFYYIFSKVMTWYLKKKVK
jgi:hypothetical protein